MIAAVYGDTQPRRKKADVKALVVEDVRKLYPGAPVGIRETPPDQIIYSGKANTPYAEEIADLSTKIDDVRTALSRDMRRWEGIQRIAIENLDVTVQQRANNELAGLHRLAERLARV